VRLPDFIVVRQGDDTCQIAAALKELYDADVSPALVSKVTNSVIEQVEPPQ